MVISGANEDGKNYTVSVNYKIRKGDTLETISKATGIPVSILAKDNNIEDINKIGVGEIISFNYHPPMSEHPDSPEMADAFPMDFTYRYRNEYLDAKDAEIKARYDEVARNGAQQYNAKHLDSKW